MGQQLGISTTCTCTCTCASTSPPSRSRSHSHTAIMLLRPSLLPDVTASPTNRRTKRNETNDGHRDGRAGGASVATDASRHTLRPRPRLLRHPHNHPHSISQDHLARQLSACASAYASRPSGHFGVRRPHRTPACQGRPVQHTTQHSHFHPPSLSHLARSSSSCPAVLCLRVSLRVAPSRARCPPASSDPCLPGMACPPHHTTFTILSAVPLLASSTPPSHHMGVCCRFSHM